MFYLNSIKSYYPGQECDEQTDGRTNTGQTKRRLYMLPLLDILNTPHTLHQLSKPKYAR